MARIDALSDHSGTIGAGGTAQTIIPANTSRRYLLVQNVSDAVMWVDIGATAVESQPSILLLANGGSLVFEGAFIPTGLVSVRGATTGKAFTAKEA